MLKVELAKPGRLATFAATKADDCREYEEGGQGAGHVEVFVATMRGRASIENCLKMFWLPRRHLRSSEASSDYRGAVASLTIVGCLVSVPPLRGSDGRSLLAARPLPPASLRRCSSTTAEN